VRLRKTADQIIDRIEVATVSHAMGSRIAPGLS